MNNKKLKEIEVPSSGKSTWMGGAYSWYFIMKTPKHLFNILQINSDWVMVYWNILKGDLSLDYLKSFKSIGHWTYDSKLFNYYAIKKILNKDLNLKDWTFNQN